MFSSCVFLSVYVCHDVCLGDLSMKSWCHTNYFAGTLLGMSSCASYVSRGHDVIDDVTRSLNRSTFKYDISPSIIELQRRSKAQNVRNANGYLSGIFNFRYHPMTSFTLCVCVCLCLSGRFKYEWLMPHKQYFSGTLMRMSSCASYVSRTHDVTRSQSRSTFKIDISMSIFELERRSKAQYVGNANGNFSGLFNFGITSGKKFLASSKWRPVWPFWNIKHSFKLTSDMERSSQIMQKKVLSMMMTSQGGLSRPSIFLYKWNNIFRDN